MEAGVRSDDAYLSRGKASSCNITQVLGHVHVLIFELILQELTVIILTLSIWRYIGVTSRPPQESEDAVRQKAFQSMSGTIPDCWTARTGLVGGQYAAVCDEITMKKTISWDFR